MKKFLLMTVLFTLLFLISPDTIAQYRNAVGLRLGDSYGLTYKTFIQSDRALDFILNLRSRKDESYFNITGLYEVHNPINGAEGLKWYYGAGGSIGAVNYKKDPDRDKDIYLSIDGVLGLDYVIPGSPLNVSLDWKPAFVLVPYADLYKNGLGLSIRIIL